jgi:hypothetical protein
MQVPLAPFTSAFNTANPAHALCTCADVGEVLGLPAHAGFMGGKF